MEDEQRFTGLFRSFHPYVLAYARRRVGTDVAQDVVADTFLARPGASSTNSPLSRCRGSTGQRRSRSPNDVDGSIARTG